jgi:hypothetical protein
LEFEAESDGLLPGRFNPFIVRSLSEEGIDIREKDSGRVPAVQGGQTVRLRDHRVLEGSGGLVLRFSRSHPCRKASLAFPEPGFFHGNR